MVVRRSSTKMVAKRNSLSFFGWMVVLRFNATLIVRSYHGGRWRICVSWPSHSSTNTNLFPKPPTAFSHMPQQRWETNIRRKEFSPQLGIELTTTRSWVRHAHHWATLFFRCSCMCRLLTYFLELIQNAFKVMSIVEQYVHVYSMGPCFHICLHIYEEAIVKHCYR